MSFYNPNNTESEVQISLDNNGTPVLLFKMIVNSLQLLVFDNDGHWTVTDIARIGDSLITLTGLSDSPITPGNNTVVIYSIPIAGRQIPRWEGPSGLDTAFQPALFGNGICMWGPGTGTAPSVWGGGALTNVGTVTHPTLSNTSLRASTARWSMVSAATANSASESRYAFARCWRGDAAGRGGFFARFRFATGSNVATQRLIVGLTNSTSAISTSQDPAALTNCIFLGNGLGDTNLQIMYNDASGVCSQIDLGTNFPSFQLDICYDLTFFCPPNGSDIGYTVTNLNTNISVSGTISSTNIPASNIFLAPHLYMNNGGTASAVTLDGIRIYLESDQ
jgi:hypothetical protein